MADIIVQTVRVQDDASAGLRSAADAADELAAAEARAAAEAEALANAARSSVQFSDAQKQAIAKTLAHEQALKLQAQAAGVSVGQMASINGALARNADAAKKAASGAEDLAKSSAKAAMGATQLGYQLSDVGVQLAGGTSPFMVMIQQGPQIAQALQIGGGAANVFGSAMRSVLGVAAAVGPALAVASVAAAALGTAYAVAANHVDGMVTTTARLNDQLAEQGSVAGKLSGEIDGAGSSWANFTVKATAAATAIREINTGMRDVAAAVAAAGRDTEQAGGRQLLSIGQRREELKRLIAAENERQASGRLNFEETDASVKAESRYRAELAQVSKEFDRRKAVYDQAKADSESLAEYNAELANSEAVLAERTKATAEATKAKAEADRRAAAWTEEAKIINEEFYARQAFAMQAIEDATDAARSQRSELQKLVETMDPLQDRVANLVPPEGLTRLEELTRLYQQLQTEAAASTEAQDYLAGSIRRVGAAIAAEEDARLRAGRSALAGGATQAVSGVAGASSGLQAMQALPGLMQGVGAAGAAGMFGAAGSAGAATAAGLAAAAGPLGAILAGLMAVVKLVDAVVVTAKEREAGEVGLITKIGQTATETMAQFESFPAALTEQLANLDLAAMSENFAKAVEGFVVGLIESLPELIPVLVEMALRQQGAFANAIIGAIPAVIQALIQTFGDPETWRAMAKAIVEVFREILTESLQVRRDAGRALASAPGDFFSVARSNMNSSGINVSLSGIVGDDRAVLSRLREGLGNIRSGLSFDRDARWRLS